MDETTSPTPPESAPFEPESGLKKKKKKDKVRAAWFTFFGRIVAQIVGAVASIVLAIFFLQKAQLGNDATSTPATRATAVRSDGRITLAVLPLSNYSGDAAQDYFADGMTEALIADLAQLEGLRVISRTSVMQYRTQQKALPQVASELGADMIVEGSVVRDGDRVRVTAQLIEADSDHHLWARSYEKTMKDVLSLQGEVAAAIAKEVKVALTPFQQGRLAQRRSVDPAVYELYLRGRHAWNLRTQAGFEAAVANFEQAIARDPDFALAHAGLSDVFVLPNTRPAVGAPSDAAARALAAATRALELDPSLAEAHTSRAAIYFFHDRNFPAAEKSFLRAIELNPGYPTARQWYAILLSEQGRDSEALVHAREAVALDPLSGPMRQALGLVHYYGRRYRESAIELRRALELAPQLPLARAILTKALFFQGAFADAVDAGEAAPDPKTADLLTILGLAYLRNGDRVRAESILNDLRARKPQPLISLAQWYAVAGQPDAAIEWLSRGIPAGSVPTPVAVDPMFDSIRRHPRFAELMAKRQ
jgi:adenylate cyclase